MAFTTSAAGPARYGIMFEGKRACFFRMAGSASFLGRANFHAIPAIWMDRMAIAADKTSLWNRVMRTKPKLSYFGLVALVAKRRLVGFQEFSCRLHCSKDLPLDKTLIPYRSLNAVVLRVDLVARNARDIGSCVGGA